MKTLHLVLLPVTLIVGGCFAIPAPYRDRLDPVAKAYSSIPVGMSRDQVQVQLGPETRTEEGGPVIWETRIDALNYNILKVWFSSQGIAQKIETTHAHGQSGPGYQASACVTRQK